MPFYQGKLEFGEKYLDEPKIWTEEITKISTKGDILMSVRAPVGPVNLNPFNEICIGRGLSAIRVTDKVLNTYLFHYLKTNQDEIAGNVGAIFQSISREQIFSIKVPLPPIAIQQKIVAELDNLEKKVVKIEVEKKALKTAIGEVIRKERGKEIKLEDITAKIGSGATPLGGEGVYKTTGITFIRSQNVYDGYFTEEGLAYIDEEQAKKLDNVAVEENDLLFNITGASIARCCIVESKYLPARVNQHVSIIRTNEKVLPKYLHLI